VIIVLLYYQKKLPSSASDVNEQYFIDNFKIYKIFVEFPNLKCAKYFYMKYEIII